tara:strand:+ start:2127 stop:2348 length:222 start_codon:yes stop_codon:yes gene_type:complete
MSLATDVITVVLSHMPHKNIDITHIGWIGATDMLPPVSKETAQLPAGATTRAVQGPRGAGALYIYIQAHRSVK